MCRSMSIRKIMSLMLLLLLVIAFIFSLYYFYTITGYEWKSGYIGNGFILVLYYMGMLLCMPASFLLMFFLHFFPTSLSGQQAHVLTTLGGVVLSSFITYKAYKHIISK